MRGMKQTCLSRGGGGVVVQVKLTVSYQLARIARYRALRSTLSAGGKKEGGLSALASDSVILVVIPSEVELCLTCSL